MTRSHFVRLAEELHEVRLRRNIPEGEGVCTVAFGYVAVCVREESLACCISISLCFPVLLERRNAMHLFLVPASDGGGLPRGADGDRSGDKDTWWRKVLIVSELCHSFGPRCTNRSAMTRLESSTPRDGR